MLSKVFSAIKRRVHRRRVVSVVAGAACLGATVYFLLESEAQVRTPDWLSWPLLEIAALSALYYSSLVIGGHAVLRRLVVLDAVPTVERLLHSMVIGLGIFALAAYVVGACGGFGPWFASLFPLGMILAGARDLPRLIRETKERSAAHAPLALGGQVLHWAATIWGGAMLVLLYLSSLTPNSFNFDAIWYHVPIAQDYARTGRLVPFFGDNHRAYPHLASLLHTWALLVPGIEHLPLRWMLMLQLEFGAVVWRIIGAAAVARYCLGGRRVPGLWVVFFLFPSVFVYDQNIAGSADHVLGMTAASLLLAVARMIQRFDLRFSVVAGVAAGCHILTKYQAIYLVVATAGVVGLRFAWLLWIALRARLRARRAVGDGLPAVIPFRHVWGAPAMILGFALLVSSPHFIKNTVYYQNPLYPFGRRLFPSSFDDWEKPDKKLTLNWANPDPGAAPPGPGAVLGNVAFRGSLLSTLALSSAFDKREPAQARDSGDPKEGEGNDGEEDALDEDEEMDFRFSSRSYSFTPQGDGIMERIVWVHRTLWDWSLRTGNRNLTKSRPYMGSLFTLLLPLLPLLRNARRLCFATFYVYLAFLTWALTNANDRYLLSFLSLPIGIAAALLVRGWALGSFARLGLVALVGSQVVFASEIPFVYADKRLNDTISLIKRGYNGAPLEERLNYHSSGRRLTEHFPEDALILGRYFKANLGFDRAMLNTHRAIQSYIEFSRLENPRDLWLICKDRGVTHLLYPEGQRKPTVVQDAVLFDALAEISVERTELAGNVIVRLADEAPPNQEPFMVVVKGIRPYQDGLFPVSKLSVDERSGRSKTVRAKRALGKGKDVEIVEQADAAYIRGALSEEAQDALEAEFRRAERFGSTSVWLRKQPRHGAAPAPEDEGTATPP